MRLSYAMLVAVCVGRRSSVATCRSPAVRAIAPLRPHAMQTRWPIGSRHTINLVAGNHVM